MRIGFVNRLRDTYTYTHSSSVLHGIMTSAGALCGLLVLVVVVAVVAVAAAAAVRFGVEVCQRWIVMLEKREICAA
jgi:hypothetical protein